LVGYTGIVTPEERFDHIDRILEQNALQIKDNTEQIKALVSAQMRTMMSLDRVVAVQAELRQSHKELEASQKKTDEMLQAFIQSLHKGGGHQ
jgi:hypothetical protein